MVALYVWLETIAREILDTRPELEEVMVEEK